MKEPKLRGPIEDRPWPDTLPARVVSPGPHPRIHGYDVYSDLAQHYRNAEIVLTALRGHAPSPAEGELFDAVLTFLCPTSVADAPTHAVVLARTCAAATPSVMAAGAPTLAEQATQIVSAHEPLLCWLADPASAFPAGFVAPDPAERASVDAFGRRARRAGIELPVLDHDPTLLSALLGAAWECGLRKRSQLVATIMSARFPLVLAAAVHEPEGELRAYPIDLPHYDYQPPEDGTES